MRKLANEELNRMSIEEFRKAEKSPLIIILDNVRSLNNVGSVFRTADAFRADSIFLCGITARPPHRDITKTALGATESVRWEYFNTVNQAVEKAKTLGFEVYAIEQAEGSILLDAFRPGKSAKIAVIFGHEVMGVSEDVMSQVNGCIEIPQFGTKHSFNISVSAGIVIWELFHKMGIEL